MEDNLQDTQAEPRTESAKEKFVASASLLDFSLWGRVKDRRVPFSFDLEVTARCNNDCRHCYINLPASDRQAAAQELTLDEIESIAGQAVKMGALWCLITGGEPLLRNDFAEIYLLLKKKGLLLSVFTNACLVTEYHVRLFQNYPPRDIEVSVYGVTKETYERVTRRPGSYAAFRRGLEILQEAGIKVRLKAMALHSNIHEMAEITRFCRARTKDYFRFDPLLHLRYDRDVHRNAEIQAERLSPIEVAAVEQADPERAGALEKDCDQLISTELKHTDCNHLFHCGAGQRSFSVGYNGAFRLCSSLVSPKCVYDLRHGSLAEAWNNFAPSLLDLRSSRLEFLESCRTCTLVNLCQWCPANAYLECGLMDGRSPYFCQVAKARAEALGIDTGSSRGLQHDRA